MKKLLLLPLLILAFWFTLACTPDRNWTPEEQDCYRQRPLPVNLMTLSYHDQIQTFCLWNYPTWTYVEWDWTTHSCFSNDLMWAKGDYDNLNPMPSLWTPYPFWHNPLQQQFSEPPEINDAEPIDEQFDPFAFDHCFWSNPFDQETLDIVDRMYNEWLTIYSEPCDFRPWSAITREEASKFYSLFAMNILGQEPDTSLSCEFTDINLATPDLRDDIVRACQLGIMKWRHWKISPKEQLYLEQAEAMFIRILIGMLPENWTNRYDSYHQEWYELWYFDKFFKRTETRRGYIAWWMYKYAHPLRDNQISDKYPEL